MIYCSESSYYSFLCVCVINIGYSFRWFVLVLLILFFFVLILFCIFCFLVLIFFRFFILLFFLFCLFFDTRPFNPLLKFFNSIILTLFSSIFVSSVCILLCIFVYFFCRLCHCGFWWCGIFAELVFDTYSLDYCWICWMAICY